MNSRAVGLTLLVTLLRPTTASAKVHVPPGPWTEVVTPHFVVFGNEYAAHLQEAGQRLELLSGLLARDGLAWGSSGGLPTTVYAFGDEETFADHVGTVRHKNYLTGGFFREGWLDPTIALDLGQYDAMSVLLHEGVHAAVARRLPNAPVWLNEGLAETFSKLAVDHGAVTIRLHRRHAYALSVSPKVSLELLFAIARGSDVPRAVGPLYTWSWGFIYYVAVARPERCAQLRRFAEALNAGRPVKSSFEAAFGCGYGEMEDEMAKFFVTMGDGTPPVAVGAVPLPLPDPAPAVAVADDDVLLRLAELLADADDKRAARARRYLDAIAPTRANDPRVLAVRARLASRGGDRAKATVAYDRALASDGKNPKTVFGAATNLILSAFPSERLPDAPPERLAPGIARARALLEGLVADHPELAPGWWALGMTYAYDPGDPQRGVDALLKCDALEPLDADTLVLEVALLVRSGRRSEAERLIEDRLKPLEDAAALDRARRRLSDTSSAKP